jgi:hypothetical protein
LLGQHVVQPGLQPAAGRGHGSLPVEERDGALKLAAVLAQLERGHLGHWMTGRLYIRGLGVWHGTDSFGGIDGFCSNVPGQDYRGEVVQRARNRRLPERETLYGSIISV